MQFNKLIPELIVTDLKKSLEFYVDILGFKIEYKRENFAFISFQGSQLMLEQNLDSDWNTGKLEHPFGRGINFQIEVEDAGLLLDSLKKNNCPLKMELKENWYRKDNKLLGQKEFLVQDPDGYLLRFAQEIGEKEIKN
ncbi:VOC family protein [Candidatus Woesearchaeota archaeon]|nr:VOC family protein [Candidatus Woesearchaeota archaeon]